MSPWCSCLFCIGWLGNVQRFITRAEPLYDSLKLLFCDVFAAVVGRFPFHQTFRNFRNRFQNSGNCWISEKRTIRPKVPEILRWKSNGTEISKKKFSEIWVLDLGRLSSLFVNDINSAQFSIRRWFFWPRSRWVGHLTQGWRRRVFENWSIFYFSILPLVCR